MSATATTRIAPLANNNAMFLLPLISPNTNTPHSAPTSPGTDVMMGKETLKLNRSLATNQQICATPHIAPLANAGPTHAGSCGSRASTPLEGDVRSEIRGRGEKDAAEMRKDVIEAVDGVVRAPRALVDEMLRRIEVGAVEHAREHRESEAERESTPRRVARLMKPAPRPRLPRLAVVQQRLSLRRSRVPRRDGIRLVRREGPFAARRPGTGRRRVVVLARGGVRALGHLGGYVRVHAEGRGGEEDAEIV